MNFQVQIGRIPPRLLRFDEELDQIVHDALDDRVGPLGIDLIQDELKEAGAVASFDLYNSWSHTVTPLRGRKRGYGLKIVSDDAPEKLYAVEQGREPGTYAPVDQLKKWIDIVGIEPDEGESIDQVAFAINQHIFEDGIEGRHPLKKARARLREDAIKPLEEEIEKGIKRILSQ